MFFKSWVFSIAQKDFLSANSRRCYTPRELDFDAYFCLLYLFLFEFPLPSAITLFCLSNAVNLNPLLLPLFYFICLSYPLCYLCHDNCIINLSLIHPLIFLRVMYNIHTKKTEKQYSTIMRSFPSH